MSAHEFLRQGGEEILGRRFSAGFASPARPGVGSVTNRENKREGQHSRHTEGARHARQTDAQKNSYRQRTGAQMARPPSQQQAATPTQGLWGGLSYSEQQRPTPDHP